MPDERCYVGPVHDGGNFSYSASSGFCVELQDHTKHWFERPLSERLTALVDLQEAANTKLQLKYKDESVAFYRAALMHYGLNDSKTKPACKKIIKQALEIGRGELKIPPIIAKVEKALKTRWEKENNAARDAYFKERLENMPAPMDIDGEATTSKATTSKTPTANTAAKITPSASAQNLGKRKATEEPPAAAKISKKVTKATPDPSAGPSIAYTRKGLEDCIGTYNLSSNSWPGIERAVIQLAMSPGKTHIWCYFDSGSVQGYGRSTSKLPPKKPRVPSDMTIQFHWRGKSTGGERTEFGSDQTVSITFPVSTDDISGFITASFLGKESFTGQRRAGPNLTSVVPHWKAQYRKFNQANYNREEVTRWGKAAPAAIPDPPMDSDSN